jgi:hypothetical protein
MKDPEVSFGRHGHKDAHAGDARAVRVFIAYLKELSLKTWVEAARRRPFVRTSDADTALQVAVRQLDPRAVFAAKEGVLDALQRFESPEGRWLTRSRYATEHLRQATEHAALAVLARRRLSVGEFENLYATFESAIPAALLVGLPELKTTNGNSETE